MMPTSVFASEQYPGHDYPEKVYSMPALSVTRIDLTNNELIFSFNTIGLYGRTLEHFGAGWITDDAYELENMDVRSIDSVSNPWSKRVFWNDTTDLSEYITYKENDGPWVKYTVDAEVDLKENTSGKMFYIAEFDDGGKWISWFSYKDCLNDFSDGMACEVCGYVDGMPDYDHTNYSLIPVRKKEKQAPAVITEPEPEVITEPESVISEPEEVILDSEPKVDNSIADLKTETTEESSNEVSPATVKTIENVMVLGSDIEEYEEDDESEDELGLSPEGPGETTLEVPTLGKTEVVFNWLPYFIAGFALGGTSTWFLVYIYNKKKLSFLR